MTTASRPTRIDEPRAVRHTGPPCRARSSPADRRGAVGGGSRRSNAYTEQLALAEPAARGHDGYRPVPVGQGVDYSQHTLDRPPLDRGLLHLWRVHRPRRARVLWRSGRRRRRRQDGRQVGQDHTHVSGRADLVPAPHPCFDRRLADGPQLEAAERSPSPATRPQSVSSGSSRWCPGPMIGDRTLAIRNRRTGRSESVVRGPRGRSVFPTPRQLRPAPLPMRRPSCARHPATTSQHRWR
jgi:hypothetical protein